MANKNRKIQYKEPGDIWCFWTKGEYCPCGANVYHHEYDGKDIYCVCNACKADLAIFKEEFIAEQLNNSIWE